jgi:hypothetical protein
MTNPTPHMTNPTPLAVPNGSVLLLYRVRIWCTRHAPLRTTTSCPHGVAFGEHWTPRSPYRRLGTRPISGISTDLRYLARSPGSLRVEDLPHTSTWFPTTGVYHICSTVTTGTTAAVGTPLALWSTTGIDGWTANRADIVPWCTDLAFSDGPAAYALEPRARERPMWVGKNGTVTNLRQWPIPRHNTAVTRSQSRSRLPAYGGTV